MTIYEASAILSEMQRWRRGLPPYDGDTPETYLRMPYTPEEFGEAIDTVLKCAIDLLSKE